MARCLTMPHKSKAIRLCCNPHQCLTALVYRVEWEIADPREGKDEGESLPFSDFPSVWSLLLLAYQLLEYQTDMRRCRFDTLGKQTSAHLALGPPRIRGGSLLHGG